MAEVERGVPTDVVDEMAEGAFQYLLQNLWMLLLLAGGVLLVCFALPLSLFLVPKTEMGPGAYQWNPDTAREIAVVLRTLGILAFIAGLFERLLVKITALLMTNGNQRTM